MGNDISSAKERSQEFAKDGPLCFESTTRRCLEIPENLRI